MASDSARYRLGLLLVTASAVAWSTAGLFTRIIALDVATMLVWRGIFGALGILVFTLALQGRSALKDYCSIGWPGWLYTVVSAAGMLCFIASLRLTTVAHVSIVYATVPFVAAMLAWLILREKPGLRAIVASLVSLVGVITAVGLSGEGTMLGAVLAFGMTLAMAGMMVITRLYHSIPILPAACLSALLSGAVAVPFSQGIEVGGHDLLLLGLFGLINSALGLALFTLGARMLPAVETALIGALDAPLAPVWIWLVFGEVPNNSTLTGGAIVLIAVGTHILFRIRD